MALASPTVVPPPVADRGVARREIRLERPWNLRLSLAPLRHGRSDPCVRIDGRTMWRATRTPQGPATEAVVVDASQGAVTAWAWGPGADWLLDGLPDLLGVGDDSERFHALVSRRPAAPSPPGWDVVAALALRRQGLRIPRSRAVVEACVPTVIEQKVTGIEAKRSYRDLVIALGSPAPGPAPGLLIPPDPERLAATPAWAMHPLGIERKRADTIRRVGTAASRLEEAADMAPRQAFARLTAVPGIGPWSAAEVGLVALGDADAVSIGDFHLPNQVAWGLAGIPRGDDQLMLQLLEPWAGHRGRVLRLLVAGGITAPKWGPHQPIRSWRGF